MATIQIQLMSGPAAGRKSSFNSSPVTFGRDADNSLVITEEHASRKHGEFVFDGEQWILQNLSQNGTKLNRKTVKDQPLPIKSGDRVYIGKQEIFSVAIEANGEEIEQDAPTISPEELSQKAMAKKTKLWIGIGGYLFLMLAVMIFLKTNKPDAPDGGVKLPTELTPQQIEAEICKELKFDKNEFHANDRIKQAKELLSRLDDSPDVQYQAHRAFMEALAYSGKPQFEGITQGQFLTVRQKLVTSIQDLYKSTYSKAARGNFIEAAQMCRDMTAIYTERDSSLYRHIEEINKIVAQAARKAKKKKGY